ncbi:hypothetical protein CDV31_017278 [Fusarium ambrosium]|uniref:Uncharacterized protein n=1 Tax=Fusarium ambrosium TaxID=131363 RepID=A0A428RL37_9HYPO|nr:hypothetical protein CDV31_017278 [Fusarium ambrosium]
MDGNVSLGYVSRLPEPGSGNACLLMLLVFTTTFTEAPAQWAKRTRYTLCHCTLIKMTPILILDNRQACEHTRCQRRNSRQEARPGRLPQNDDSDYCATLSLWPSPNMTGPQNMGMASGPAGADHIDVSIAAFLDFTV